MKRLVAFLLIIVSLFSVALADDYSSMTYNELKTELDKILLEITKKNINTDRLLCDSDGFKVYITGDIQFDYDDYNKSKKVLVIPITAFNESNQALNLWIDTLSFNGWEVDFPLCLISLDANKKCKDTIIVEDFLDKTDIVAIFQIKEIEAYYRVNDNDYNEVNKNCRTTVILE